MSADRFNLFSFAGKMRVLHLSWVAFFITFMLWFNHAPLLQAIGASLALTSEQIKTLLIINVAMAIPARVLIGMLTDRFGPRLAHLNGVLQVLSQLSAVPAPTGHGPASARAAGRPDVGTPRPCLQRQGRGGPARCRRTGPPAGRAAARDRGR